MAALAQTSTGMFPTSEEVPRSLGRYDLVAAIASGGMATVYLARDRERAGDSAMVAVKCCHPHLRREEEFATLFVDEARLAARIHHPNVVATLDASMPGADSLFMVMEFVDGYSLWQILRAAQPSGVRMPVGIACRIVVDALRGLHAAHELCDDAGRPLNIVHRDVTPHNIMVGIDGVSRIVDFGVAKAESRLSVTRDGFIKGKLAYMAPEQHGLTGAGKTEVTRSADSYAAAVVLWEALAGRALFRGETDTETAHSLVRCEIPRIATIADLPAGLDAAVTKALAPTPEDRFATAQDFADAIEASGVGIATGSRRDGVSDGAPRCEAGGAARTVGAFFRRVGGPARVGASGAVWSNANGRRSRERGAD